jgi:hypothetical protein
MRRVCPSHATVVAYLALFMAMGGTAYASVQWSSADIADGSLLSVDVQDNSLTGADISPGSITTSDLAAGTIDSGDGSAAAGAPLAVASNPGAVTGPMYSTDATAAQQVLSVSFDVPAGESYYVQVSAQTVFDETPYYAAGCDGYISGGGGVNVQVDGSTGPGLLGMLHGRLPGGATGGSQAVVFGPGEHVIEMVNQPTICQSVSEPQYRSYTASFLTVNLLAKF